MNYQKNTNLLEEQFALEKELATRLLSAPKETRKGLYSQVYQEFAEKYSQAQQPRPEALKLQLKLLSSFINKDSIFLEVACGDGRLSLEIAKLANQVIAIEATPPSAFGSSLPNNLYFVMQDHPPYPLADQSIDLAYNCHFIEHLHPEDALEHLAEMHRLLRPGGRCLSVTPQSLLGPHDVSKYFASNPQGLHLCEYSHHTLVNLYKRSGFENVKILSGINKAPRIINPAFFILFEHFLTPFPKAFRSKILSLGGKKEPFRILEQVKILGIK